MFTKVYIQVECTCGMIEIDPKRKMLVKVRTGPTPTRWTNCPMKVNAISAPKALILSSTPNNPFWTPRFCFISGVRDAKAKEEKPK
jgi:hypothetical protein